MSGCKRLSLAALAFACLLAPALAAGIRSSGAATGSAKVHRKLLGWHSHDGGGDGSHHHSFSLSGGFGGGSGFFHHSNSDYSYRSGRHHWWPSWHHRHHHNSYSYGSSGSGSGSSVMPLDEDDEDDDNAVQAATAMGVEQGKEASAGMQRRRLQSVNRHHSAGGKGEGGGYAIIKNRSSYDHSIGFSDDDRR